MRLVLLLLFTTFAPGPLSEKGLRSFCAAAREHLAADPALGKAAALVFPKMAYTTRDIDCIYPVQVLRYGDAEALISIGGKPGEACHGCAASMSAYVLRRTAGNPKVVARFADFSSTGTFGNPGKISALRLAGHDAFAVESGGVFQGYSFSGLSLFIFKAGRLLELKPGLSLSSSNEGAVGEGPNAFSVEGAWHIGPGSTVSIDYKVETRGRTRRATATWIVAGDTLTLTTGKVPPELQPERK